MTRASFVAALGLLSLAVPLGAQGGPSPAAPSRDTVLAAAREIMADARFCTFVTVGLDGHPQARVVDPFTPEGEMTVWLATKPTTRKVAQIRADPRVTLLYFDAGTASYVTLVGHAELVRDPVEKAKRWKPAWSGMYEDENRGEDYLLIRVRVDRLEIVSGRHGLRNDPRTWRPVVLDLR
ncbi:MAG: pyridoxamine 5'-phosphate oxidase family protein [Gemmatimonadetes bacterium]|nr:pyridoxamine 5'-phosphate oxidase family protein [Gemmatimonadota bacterium]